MGAYSATTINMAIKLKNKKNTKKKIVKKVVPTKVRTKKSKTQLGEGASAIKIPAGNYFEGIGRRKVATARVRIYKTKGDFVVNGIAAGKYFDGVIGASTLYNKPLNVAQLLGEFAITVKVSGSGVRSQLGAVTLGMARALIKYDPELRDSLKKAGLLSRDDRMKETRKIGMGGKARRKRQSPRR